MKVSKAVSDDIVVLRQVTVDEFMDLRQSVGWGLPDRASIRVGLKNTIFSVCVERKGKLVGYGRVVGDGGFTVYIQDVIVKPEYQRQGVGLSIMNSIMDYVKANYCKGTYVGLMASLGRETFYKRFGFIERPNDKCGAGMIQFL